jgi:hypothetical protein
MEPLVYLAFARDDTEFGKRLSKDIAARGVKNVTSDADTDERFAALHQATHVVFVLSNAAVENNQFDSVFRVVNERKSVLIAVRSGPVDTMPKELKGILPLDFSSEAAYEDSLDALIEDVNTRQKRKAALPEKATESIESPDPDRRKIGIEMLRAISDSDDEDLRELAREKLSNLIFRDPDSSVKMLARATLQLFDQKTEKTTEAVKNTAPVAPVNKDIQPLIQKADEGQGAMIIDLDEPQDTGELLTFTKPGMTSAEVISAETAAIEKMTPVWETREWGIVPVFGLVIAVLAGLFAENLAVALPIGLVWLVLPWLNTAIRGGGKFRWEMPGPLVGNSLIATVLALLGVIILIVAGTDLDWLPLIAIILSSMAYGGLIGWMSSLYTRN